MSGKISGLIWDYAIPHTQAWILLAMADHADHEGNNVYPSVDLIAWKTSYSERQVQRVIKQLREAKILVPVEEESGHVVKYRIDLSGVPLKEPRKKKVRQDVAPDKMSPPTPRQVTKRQGRGDIAMSEGGDIWMSPEPSLTVNEQESGGVRARETKPVPVPKSTPPPLDPTIRGLMDLGLTRSQAVEYAPLQEFTPELFERLRVWKKNYRGHSATGGLCSYLKEGRLPDDLPKSKTAPRPSGPPDLEAIAREYQAKNEQIRNDPSFYHARQR